MRDNFEWMREQGYDDEFIEFFIAFGEELKHEAEREKVLIINPKKHNLAHTVYKQLKHILDECCAKYKIRIKRDSVLGTCILIEVFTDSFSPDIDTYEVYRDIISKVDGFDCHVAYRVLEDVEGAISDDAVAFIFEIDDGFIELTDDADDFTEFICGI